MQYPILINIKAKLIHPSYSWYLKWVSAVKLFNPIKTTFIKQISIARGKYISGSDNSEYNTVHPHEIKKKLIEIKKSEML